MNTIEFIGFLCGIAGVYFTMKENILCFPLGIINVLLSAYLFYFQRLYADVIQQIVYFILISYGWYQWYSIKIKKELLISKTNKIAWIKLLAIFILTSVVLGFFLKKYTDASFPLIDSSATAASFVAQYMIAKKKIENWLIWIAVNITYIAIYLNKHLFLYAILFAIYFLFAVKGYYEWKKALVSHEKSV